MSKITTIGNKGVQIIKESEKFVPKPYKCPAGVWTIGFGTTFYFDTKKKVTKYDNPISEIEADRLLRGHVNTVFAPLVDKLCRDDLNQNQFDAIVDFTYNTGGGYIDKKGKFQYYNLYEHVNDKLDSKSLKEYWQGLALTGGGKKLPGLFIRRKKEVELYFKSIK